jgi:anti-anti-sigma factor
VTLADIRYNDHGNAEVATLTGEIDLSNTSRVRQVITQAMPHQSLVLILDLGGVDFFDSAGHPADLPAAGGPPGSGQVLQLVIPWGSPTNDALSLAGLTHHVDVLETVTMRFGGR